MRQAQLIVLHLYIPHQQVRLAQTLLLHPLQIAHRLHQVQQPLKHLHQQLLRALLLLLHLHLPNQVVPLAQTLLLHPIQPAHLLLQV